MVMKKLLVLVFTEGTTIMHSSTERIREYSSYVPVKNAVKKLTSWKGNGCEIFYLTSRTEQSEINQVKKVLVKYKFPRGPLYHRKEGEEYKDVVERVKPDILVEDDCASIGADEIIAPKLNPKLNIKAIVVKEFSGIDHLPDEPVELMKYK